MAQKKLKHKKPGEIAAEHVGILDLAKQGYKSADAAMELLLTLCRDEDCPTCGGVRFKNGGIVKLPDGRKFRITDEFARGKYKTNVGQNVRRFSLEPAC